VVTHLGLAGNAWSGLHHTSIRLRRRGGGGEPPLKPVIWVGSSWKDLREFPELVQDRVGYAPFVAQQGGKHRDAKALSGFAGAGVVEIIEDYRGDTFRAVYTVRDTPGAVYVPHAFQKKSKTGSETPRRDMEYPAAAGGGRTDCEGKETMSKKGYEIGSGNVSRDIGVPDAEEHLVKGQLVFKIDAIMKKRSLKQVEAAALFGVRQPDVSKMLRGEFRQFSVERLLRFLVALDQDVEIVVKPHRDGSRAPALHVS
jgi:phage-related protein/predicted XRE-type DNA-binding protein